MIEVFVICMILGLPLIPILITLVSLDSGLNKEDVKYCAYIGLAIAFAPLTVTIAILYGIYKGIKVFYG